MHEKVREFLEKKKEEEIKANKDILINMGLYEKVYSPDNKNVYREYPFVEYDPETGNRYYKHQVLKLTDEEYEAVKKYFGMTKYKKINGISAFLTVVAVFSFVMAVLGGELGYFAIFLITGALLMGISEIISILHDIRNK